MKENVAIFGQPKSLIGIITEPEDKASKIKMPAFIFLNAGVIHRIGANRLHVRMARKFAEMGFIGFRFDLSGIGDSSFSEEDVPFEIRRVAETQAAMDFLEKKHEISKFILVGNCSGATTAFFAAKADKRVAGAVLINPQGPKKLLRYYMRLILLNPKFLYRFFSGKAKYKKEVHKISTQTRMGYKYDSEDRYGSKELATDMELLITRGTKILIVHCQWDPGLDFFKAKIGNTINKFSDEQKLWTRIIPGINHDFSLNHGQESLLANVTDWASTIQWN
jgi:hypothetical protein